MAPKKLLTLAAACHIQRDPWAFRNAVAWFEFEIRHEFS